MAVLGKRVSDLPWLWRAGPSHKPKLGHTIFHRARTSATLESEKKSLAPRSPWRASSLRSTSLASLGFISFILLAVVEVLRQTSTRNQGLKFVRDTSNLSTSAFLAINFAPITITVLYSILWSLVDLDVKRLEPYYQLSRPGGAPGKLLFLEYTYEMSLFVPFMAAKARHWGVLMTALVFISVSMVLVSLSSGLLSVAKVSIVDTSEMKVWPNLASAEAQVSLFTGEYVNHAASIIVAGATLPAYTTRNYTITPFRPDTSERSANDTWTANTTIFWAKPTCHMLHQPLEVSVGVYSNYKQTIAEPLTVKLKQLVLPGGRCSVDKTISIDFEDTEMTLYKSDWIRMNNFTNPNIMQAEGDCPYAFNLASFVRARSDEKRLWATITNNSVDSVTYLCSAEYFKAQGQVTVRASDQTVIAVGTLENRSRMEPSMFNADAFETRLAQAKLPFANGSALGLETFHSTVFNTFDIESRISLGVIPKDAATHPAFLLNNNLFGQELERAYQLAFAVGFRSAFSTIPQQSTIMGSYRRDLFAVTVVSAFALVSEAILGVSTLLCLALFFHYRKRPSVLRSDPDSLAAMIALIAGHGEGMFNSDFLSHGVEHRSTTKLAEIVRGRDYKLSLQVTPSGEEICTLQSKSKELDHHECNSPTDCSKTLSNQKSEQDALPFLITRLGACIAYSTLILMSAALAYILVVSQRSQGFAYMASGDFLSKLLWSFLPTLLSTLVSPGWSGVHRDLCVLEPFVHLQKGRSTASDSLCLPYASRPPVVTVFYSIFRKHYTLALVAAAFISTNLLAISIGSLFSEAFVTVETTLQFTNVYTTPMLAPFWDRSILSLDNIFDLVRTNITENTPLAPFTSIDYSFLPLKFPDNMSTSLDRFRGNTVGLGATLICEPFAITEGGLGKPGITIMDNSTEPSVNLDFTTTLPGNDTQLPCRRTTKLLALPTGNDTQSIRFYLPLSVVEGGMPYYFNVPNQEGLSGAMRLCAESRILILETGGAITRGRARSGNGLQSYNITGSLCRPQVVVKDFAIVFDGAGQVHSYNEVGSARREDNFFSIGHANFTSIYHSTFGVATMRSATARFDWPGLLTARARDAVPHVNDEATLRRTASQVYANIFSNFVSHYRDRLFANATSKKGIQGLGFSRERRMVASVPMFAITLGLLVLYGVVGAAVLTTRRHRYAPRLPKSLGSIILYICNSKMLEDFQGTHAMSSKQREDHVVKLGRKYGFGWFIGVDGKLHRGIEREPLLRA